MRLLFSDSPPDHPPPDVTLHKTCTLCPIDPVGRRLPCYRPWSLTDGTFHQNHNNHHHHRHAAVTNLRLSLTNAMAEHMAEIAFATRGSATAAALKASVAVNPAPASTVASKVTPVQYHCSFCRFACTWKYDLELHMKQKHGVHKKLWNG